MKKADISSGLHASWEKATSVHRQHGVSANFIFYLRYLGENYVHTKIPQQLLVCNHFFSLIGIWPQCHACWSLQAAQTQQQHEQRTAGFWTNAQSIHFLLRPVVSVSQWKKERVWGENIISWLFCHTPMHSDEKGRIGCKDRPFILKGTQFPFGLFPEIYCKKGNTDICLEDWYIMWQFCREQSPSLVPSPQSVIKPWIPHCCWFPWLCMINLAVLCKAKRAIGTERKGNRSQKN